MDTDFNFKLQISIRRADDDSPVFSKHDGERFANSITVKLNVATKYNILFTTRPAMGIKKVLLKGEELGIELQKREKPDDRVCVYHTDWSTEDYEVTKSNARSTVPFVIVLDSGLSLSVSTQIQVKFYPEKETSHVKWGQEFHLLDIECHRKEGANHLTTEEQYI